MTNTNNQGSSDGQKTEVDVTKKQQASVGSKITGGLSWWLNSLTGKPQKSVPQVESNTSGTKALETDTGQSVEENSVSQDVENLKKLVGKLKGKVAVGATPAVSKGVNETKEIAQDITKKVGKNSVYKVLKIVLVILISAFILLFVFMLVQNMGQGTGVVVSPTPTQTTSTTATPTISVFTPTQKSIYADDPVVLKLEEDINVITRESGSRNLKETQLNPPVLDFNVTF